jgi:pilus assembly protein CpaE
MLIQMNTAIVDPHAENRAELAEVLAGYGVTSTQQFATLPELDAAIRRGDAPQVALVNLDPDTGARLDELAPMPRNFPGTTFFAMSQVLDPQLLMRAMSMGIREFIPLPMTEQSLRGSLERVATQHDSERRAKIIQVIPTVGGCGSTTVACNVAASLAQTGKKTVLLDLDLVRGGAVGAFDLRPRYTLADVLESADRLDQQFVDNALVTHEKSGLKLLARPELMEETQRVTAAGLQKLLGLLGRIYDYVVIDSIMSLDPVWATATSLTDINIVVMQLNVPAAQNAERFVAALRRMGIETTRIKVLVNRFVKKGWDIEPREVERALGLDIGWTVPNDYKTAIGAINFGEPAVCRSPRSEMAIALRRFTSELVGTPPAVENPGRKSAA